MPPQLGGMKKMPRIHEQLNVSNADNLKIGIDTEFMEQLRLGKFHLGIQQYEPDEGGVYRLVKQSQHWNQVQTLFKTHIADALADQGETQMSHMAIGTGTGQAVGDTTLATELERNVLSGATPTHSGAVVTYTATFGPSAFTGDVTEAAIFNDASAGTMGLYSDGFTYTKSPATVLNFTWTFTIN